MSVAIEALPWQDHELGSMHIRKLTGGEQAEHVKAYQESYQIADGFTLVREQMQTATPIVYPEMNSDGYVGVCFAFADVNKTDKQIAFPHLYHEQMNVTNGYHYPEQKHDALNKPSYYTSLKFRPEYLLALHKQQPLPSWLLHLVDGSCKQVVTQIQVPTSLRELGWQICRMPRSETLSDCMRMQAKALSWLAMLLEIPEQMNRSHYQQQDVMIAKKIQQAINIIQNEFHTELTITSLASRVALNECYLKKGFKNETGLGIHEYLTEYRLEQSCQLLRCRPDLSIKSVASMCGYQPSYFSQVFKSRFVISPNDFRKQ